MRLTRRILSLIPLLLLPAASLFAQSEGKPEVFVGYSNLQGQGLQDQNGLFNNRATLHGFDTEVTPFLGTAWESPATSRSTKTAARTAFLQVPTRLKRYLLLHGRSNGESGPFEPPPAICTISGRGAHTRFNVSSERTISGGSLSRTFQTGATDFALGVGGGLDWRINDGLKLRVFQFDYAPVFLSNQSINTTRQAGAIEPVV